MHANYRSHDRGMDESISGLNALGKIEILSWHKEE